MKPVPDRVPIEELDRDTLSLCTRINAATCELLVLVREFDERDGFLKWERQRTRKTQNVNRTPRFQVVILPNS